MERFIVHYERASLRWLFTVVDPSGLLIMWLLRLSEFDFEIRDKNRNLNSQADDLSRLSTQMEP